MLYGSLEVSINCPACDQPVYPEGPALVVHCHHCQGDFELKRSFWQERLRDLWDSIANGSLAEGTHHRGQIIGELRVSFAYFHDAAGCAACHEKWELDPKEVPTVHVCPRCQERLDVIEIPSWLRRVVPQAALLTGVAPQDGQGASPLEPGVSGPVALTCPGCSGSLVIDGRDRLVKCQYCGMNVYLPDDLWLRLHPGRTKRRWGIAFAVSEAPSGQPRAKKSEAKSMPESWPYRGLSPDCRRGVDSGILPVGELLWKSEPGLRGNDAQFAVASGRVFVGSAGSEEGEADPADGVYCYDVESGRLLWRFSTQGREARSADSGCAAGITVGYGNCYFPCRNGFIYCVGAESGDLVWERRFDSEIYSPPTLAHDRVYLSGPDDRLYCLDPATGESIWDIGYSLDCQFPPLLLGERVYFLSSDPFLQCADAFSGVYRWAVALPDAPECDLIHLADTLLFRDESNVYCVSVTDGRLIWQHESKTDIRTQLTGDGDCAFFGNEDRLVCLKADSGRQRWANKIEAGVFTACGVADGRVYVGEYGNQLYCLDERTGRTFWKREVAAMDETAIVVVNGRVFLHAEDGAFLCLR